MKRNLSIAFISALAGLYSCTEEISWDLKYEESDLMVVEGKITDEAREHEVKLSWPVYEINTTAEPVSGALVEIYDGRRIVELREDRFRPGIYLTPPAFAGKVDSAYRLRVRYGDFDIRGVSRMREVLDWPSMNVYVVQQEPRLYEAIIGNQNGPSVIRLELDWSHVSGYEDLPEEENHALVYHYILGSVDVNRIFSPAREHVQFPPGTIVIREKESVTPVYAEFLRGMLSETDWRGGVFDVQPGNARSNLSGGAVGFFTAAAVIRDTIIVE